MRPLGVNHLPGRELERVAAVEVVDALDETLAEARLPDDERAVVILKRAGDDLGRRRGALVGQHDHRNRRSDRRRLGGVILLRTLASLHRGDLLPLLQEHVGDLEALRENAARIAAQVDDDSARALRLELLDGGGDVLRGVLIELLQRDVADLVAERERVRNRRDVNLARG